MIAMRPRVPLDQRARAAPGLRVEAFERGGGRPEIGAGELHRGENGERVLHQVTSRRAEAIVRRLARECRR